jgi:hypothetical protein
MKIKAGDLLNIMSIKKNIESLIAQLNEYSFLTISPEQSEQLDELEKELHDLRAEITHDETF